jgi:glutathione S-transferase
MDNRRVMRLYHMPGSRPTRVLWMLEEIGMPYEVTLMTWCLFAMTELEHRYFTG